jgi:hypothetical protein
MLTEAIHSLADTGDQVLFTRSEETRLLVRPELRNVRNVTALQEIVP